MATKIGNMPDEISKVIHDFIRPEMNLRFRYKYIIVWNEDDENEEQKVFYTNEGSNEYNNYIWGFKGDKAPYKYTHLEERFYNNYGIEQNVWKIIDYVIITREKCKICGCLNPPPPLG